MTSGAVDALLADRAALLERCAGLDAEGWQAPSGCQGWSVQDVVAHMGALYGLVVDSSALPDANGVPTEKAQELYVEHRRAWSAAQVLDDYASVSEKALDRLAGLESKDFELPLGDLGVYPASLLPNAYAFDHYTHIRCDLSQPRGPWPDPPPSDEVRLVPTVEWIAAAATQQNAELLKSIDGAIEIAVTGLAARTFTVGTGDVAARVECPAHDLVVWSTQRGNWDALDVKATGDDAAVAAAQRLHIF